MKKERLTASQMRYLFAIYRLQASGANITQVALELGVSKPSSRKMIGTLEALGLVTKEEDGEIILTLEGKKQAEELDIRHNLLTHSLLSFFQLDINIAREDAYVLLSELSEKFLEQFMRHIEDRSEWQGLEGRPKALMDDFSGLMEDGTFILPFKILRSDGKKTSMGNKGFMHPCRLQIQQHKGEIYLQAKEIYYRSTLGRHLHGKLNRLSYWDGSRFVIVVPQQDTYAVPICAMEIEKDSTGKPLSGTIMIKARASVGIFHMPESMAVLRLNLGMAKEEDEEQTYVSGA